ncbi:MAG: cytosine permease [Tissierellia bacterium]|nr:cytosine permease [Tissierellia bacterium]
MSKEKVLNHDVEVQQDSGDYEGEAVPLHARKSFFSLTIVWTGFVFLITSMMAGGGLADGLNLKEIILATLMGNVFLSAIAIAIAIIASKSGLSFALITRFPFGFKGSKIATLFVPIVNVGWYTIQSATYGHFISSILGIEGTTGELIIMFISAIVMGVFALVGMNALTILGYVAIPAVIYLSLGAAIKATMIGGVDHLINYIPPATISLTDGMGIVIGTWILSTATCIADIMRFAKSTKQAIMSTVLGLIGGNSMLILCGAIAAIGTKNSDLCAMLLSLGLVVPSFVLMTTNIFTTNATNLYSTSLNLSNSFSLERKKLIAIILVLSGLLTFIRPHEIDNLFVFLDMLGKIVPPLAGIILADYYIVHKGNYDHLDSAKKMDWNLAPWITWAVTLIFVFKVDWGLPALNGIVISLILYPILNGLLNGRKK